MDTYADDLAAVVNALDLKGAITIGHPAPGGAAGSPTRRTRKPHGEVVHHGRWSS